MKMQEQPEPYITIPRYIASDYREGKISLNEWILYTWIRTNANPYGIASANISALRTDVFPKVTENYVNQLLLSLRDKKYLYFASRQGHRGSFEVHFGDWLLPAGRIKRLNTFFGLPEVRSTDETPTEQEPEVTLKSDALSQKLNVSKSELDEVFSFDSPARSVRSPYNDTDKEKDKEKNESLAKPSFKGKRVQDFMPRNSEEARCQEIAVKVNEEHIDWILSVLRRYGIGIIETAWGRYKEDVGDGKTIYNSAAYFQGIIKALLQ